MASLEVLACNCGDSPFQRANKPFESYLLLAKRMTLSNRLSTREGSLENESLK